MATLTVTQSDLTNAVTFLDQFLTTNLPKYDFSPGTANRDIAINSMAYIVAFIRGEVASVKSSQSLLKLSSLSPDDSVDQVVDEILSNWFINRKTGLYASGFAQLSFSKDDIGVLVIQPTDIWTRGGQTFKINTKNSAAYEIQTTDLVQNTDNLGVTYYTVSIPLVSTTVGSASEVLAGKFESFPNLSPYLTTVQNLEQFVGGENIETSTAMIARSTTAITQRTLDTLPAIKTNLTDNFPQVLDVYPIGMADPEMIRDLIAIPQGSGKSITIHRGSMMDAYMKMPLEFGLSYAAAFPSSGGLQVQNYTVNSLAITAILLPSFPIYKIYGVYDNTTTPPTSVPFTTVTENPELWNTNRQKIYLSVDSQHLSQYLDIVYDTVTDYGDVQAYVETKQQRIMVADLLTKASFGLYLQFQLNYYPSTTNAVVSATEVLNLQAFIHGQTLGKQFLVSDILNQFVTDYPGNRPQLPFVVVGTLLLPNGLTLTINYQDEITAPDRYGYNPLTPTVLTPLFPTDASPVGMTIVYLKDLQVSARTLRYIVPVGNITLNALSS
jgi:hypothetical protein